MLIIVRKCLLLDVKASGHPTTGQNILPLPKLVLLRLRMVAPVLKGGALIPPKIFNVLASCVADTDCASETGLGTETKLDDSPSCSMGVGTVEVSMWSFVTMANLIWHFSPVCFHITYRHTGCINKASL